MILKKVPLFGIDSYYSTFWYLLSLLIFLIHIFSIPLDLSFDLKSSDYYETLWFVSHDLPMYIGILDILYSLNTAYYSKGVYVKERKKILRFYFKWNFWLDLFIVGPLIIISFEATNNEIWHINFLIIAIKVKILVCRLEDFFQFKAKPQGIINLMKLILMVLFVANLSGCAWHFLAKWEINNLKVQNTWLEFVKIENDNWQIKYVNSLYFSIVTMVTVGYGDICPQNTIEKGFSINMIILSCGFFAYALNSVGIILKEMYREDDEFKFLYNFF